MTRRPNGHDHEVFASIIPGPRLLSPIDWADADFPPQDHLVGELLSTTTRALFAARTGCGKTMFFMALALIMSLMTNITELDRNFLHWKVRRPAKILYIDAEMPAELARERLFDTMRRLGLDATDVADLDQARNFHLMCLDEMPIRPPPLNTPEGQQWLDQQIEYVGGYDFIFFDNVASLLEGSLNEDGPWAALMPYVYSLTRRRIGQLWIHHTNDQDKPFGTKTRDWHFDASGVFEKLDRPGTDIAFKLQYLKTRRRKPANQADFEPKIITLERDQWFVEDVDEAGRKAAPAPKSKPPSPLAVKFYNALNDALCTDDAKVRPQSAGRICVAEAAWTRELYRLALINGEKPDSLRALISKNRLELLAADWIACNEGFIWSIKT